MKKVSYTETQIKELMRQATRRSYAGRLARLSFLLPLCVQDGFPVPVLAYEYYEEARLCWYMGAFVATIIMAQLSFEELIRSHYRGSQGVGGVLKCGKSVDKAGFYDLVKEAENDKWLEKQDAQLLHNLRKNMRNAFVHAKDIEVGQNGKPVIDRPNFFTQGLKVHAPTVLGTSVEDEAREAVRLLAVLFPKISSRFWGL